MEQNSLKIRNAVSVTIIGICAYLGIDYMIFALYTVLMFIDFFTGVVKGVVHKDLSSTKAISWFASKFFMILLILAVGITCKILHFEFMAHILSGLFSILALAELYSIIGNIYEVKTGKKVKEFDAVSMVVSKLLTIIKNKLETDINKGETTIDDYLQKEKKEINSPKNENN